MRAIVLFLLFMCDNVLAQHFSTEVSKNYMADVVEIKQDRPPRIFDVKFKLPLVEQVKGNSHITNVYFFEDFLGLFIQWDSHANKIEDIHISWIDIFTGKVKYGLEAFYKVGSVERAEYDSNLVSQQQQTVTVDNIIHIKSKPGILLRVSDNYKIISVTCSKNFMFIAVNSDQGYVDGELLIPHLTTQIFMVPIPN